MNASGAGARAVEVVMALDFGFKRIGVALGDTLTCTARPLQTIVNSQTGPDWQGLAKLMKQHGPRQLVVGLPLNEDGTPGTVAEPAAQFCRELETRFGLPVSRCDERYSSMEAANRLRESRASGQRGRRLIKGDLDAGAAAVILETWFSNRS